MLIELRDGFSINPYDLYAAVMVNDTGELSDSGIPKCQILLYFMSQKDKCMSLDFDDKTEMVSVYKDIIRKTNFA